MRTIEQAQREVESCVKGSSPRASVGPGQRRSSRSRDRVPGSGTSGEPRTSSCWGPVLGQRRTFDTSSHPAVQASPAHARSLPGPSGQSGSHSTDPLADRLAGERGRQIMASMPPAASRDTAWTSVVRTRLIDDLLTRSIAEGADCVINLAAGLEHRRADREPATFRLGIARIEPASARARFLGPLEPGRRVAQPARVILSVVVGAVPVVVEHVLACEVGGPPLVRELVQEDDGALVQG